MIYERLLVAGIFIIVARLSEQAFRRLGLPGMLGEVMAGFAIFPLSPISGDGVQDFAFLGAMALAFLIGLNMDIEALVESGKQSVLSSILSLLVILLPAYLFLDWLGYDWATILMLLSVISSTCLAAGLEDLLAAGIHLRPIWQHHRASATIDELVAIGLLLMGLSGGSPGMAVLEIALFTTGAIILGHFSAKYLHVSLTGYGIRLAWAESVLVGILFLIAALGQRILGSAIETALIFGLILSRGGVHDSFVEKVEFVSYSIFVPIMTVYIGVKNILSFQWSWLPGLSFLLLATVGRFIGSFPFNLSISRRAKDALFLSVADMAHLEVPLLVVFLYGITWGYGLITSIALVTIMVGTVASSLFYDIYWSLSRHEGRS